MAIYMIGANDPAQIRSTWTRSASAARWVAVVVASFAAGCLVTAAFVLPGANLPARPSVQTELRPAPTPIAASSPTTIPPIPILTAGIDAIEARRETTPALFRLTEAPAIMVLDFPDLHLQAQMLNRVATFIEKADMPRDRIVTEAELAARIQAEGSQPDTYYYGHDYRAAQLAAFFRLAREQNAALNPAEMWLRDTLTREGLLAPGAVGALITIPGLGGTVDAAARSAIFRHELAHGAYFTDPGYQTLTRHLWDDMLGAAERAAVRAFLGESGYDMKDEDLMANEGQAYLIHTRDPRFFRPAQVGLSPAREASLRSSFVGQIRLPWLRASALLVAPVKEPVPEVAAPTPATVQPAMVSAPTAAPRRPSKRTHHAAASPTKQAPGHPRKPPPVLPPAAAP